MNSSLPTYLLSGAEVVAFLLRKVVARPTSDNGRFAGYFLVSEATSAIILTVLSINLLIASQTLIASKAAWISSIVLIEILNLTLETYEVRAVLAAGQQFEFSQRLNFQTVFIGFLLLSPTLAIYLVAYFTDVRYFIFDTALSFAPLLSVLGFALCALVCFIIYKNVAEGRRLRAITLTFGFSFLISPPLSLSFQEIGSKSDVRVLGLQLLPASMGIIGSVATMLALRHREEYS